MAPRAGDDAGGYVIDVTSIFRGREKRYQQIDLGVTGDAMSEGRQLFLHAKNNLAAPPQGLAFWLEQREVEEAIVASRALFELMPVAITADQAMAAEATGADARTAKAEATEFLQNASANGPTPAAKIMRMAREHGLTQKAIRSARET